MKNLASSKYMKITPFHCLEEDLRFLESISLLRSASLRAGLRRKEVTVALWTQHLRGSVCARARPRWLDPFAALRGRLCWATFFRLLRLHLRTGSARLALRRFECRDDF